MGAYQLDKEPFSEWWPRVRYLLKHVPENVAEHWIYENFGSSPYAFLPLDRLRFEHQVWSLVQLDAVSFGSNWRNKDDLTRLDGAQLRNDKLALMMINAGTWPHSVLVLDNHDGLKERSGEPMGRWHLIEGHRRLTYLRCLAHKGTAKAEHGVWVVTISPGSSANVEISDSQDNYSTGYIMQKLSGAIEALALGVGTIQERLYHASRGGLLHLDERFFPVDKRDLWTELMDGLGRGDPMAMGVREASHHARTILELWEWNCRERGREDAMRRDDAR